MHPRGCGRRAGRRSDCWLVAVRTRTDKGCCSFKHRTNPHSSTTEECPPWLDSFFPGKFFSVMQPASYKKVREREPRTYGNRLWHPLSAKADSSHLTVRMEKGWELTVV